MTMIFNGTTGITFPDGQTQDVGVPDPGTNGNVLTSNGTIWTSAAPGTYSQWTTSGSDIYYNTGNVGIGTSTVGYKLDVQQNGAVNYTLLRLGNTDAGGAGSNILFTGNGNQAARIKSYFGSAWSLSLGTDSNLDTMVMSSGNVGIGTTSPGSKLVVQQSNNTGDAFRVFANGTDTQLITRYLSSSDVWQISASYASTGAYKPISFFTSDAERMRITSGGNVGIGTSSPQDTLDVGNTSDYQLRLGYTGLNHYRIGRNVTNGLLYFNGSQSGNTGYVFTGADGERMRITSSGAVGIGTSSPTANLTVRDPNGSSSGNLSLAAGTGGGGASRIIMGNADSGGTAGPSMIVAANRDLLFGVGDSFSSATGGNFTERMRIDALGSLLLNTTSNGYGVTGGIYAPSVYGFTTASAANMFIESGGFMRRSTSSIKYKTDVQDATHGLADVMKLRPVTYKGINDGETVFGGLIAEEVHDAGLTEFVQYADDGSPDALAYGQMVSLCVKAIQEQQAIINELKTRIETLENK